jgi:hypothetical protein
MDHMEIIQNEHEVAWEGIHLVEKGRLEFEQALITDRPWAGSFKDGKLV